MSNWNIERCPDGLRISDTLTKRIVQSKQPKHKNPVTPRKKPKTDRKRVRDVKVIVYEKGVEVMRGTYAEISAEYGIPRNSVYRCTKCLNEYKQTGMTFRRVENEV